MAYVYFHKSDNGFQFISDTQRDCPWNDEYVVDGATMDQVYALKDGVPVLTGVISPLLEDPTPVLALAALRADRNRRLSETDWWANSDVPMTEERRAYRQALRDITDTYTSIADVVWPTKP